MLAIFKGPNELAPQTLSWETGFRPLTFGRTAPVMSIKAGFEHPQPTSIPSQHDGYLDSAKVDGSRCIAVWN